jgi:hypothetical protein
MTKRRIVVAWLASCVLISAGCADDSEDSNDSKDSREAAGSKSEPGAQMQSSQRPPQGAAAVEAWLKKGEYKDWQCESGVHAARSPSPHGFNRICSNDAISSRATDDGAWPEGAAGVKELYDSADSKSPMGYSVYLKTADDSEGGAKWYWYERIGDQTVADGFGSSGPAKAICVACHAAAGSDDAHTPSAGGRDQVYTPVP